MGKHRRRDKAASTENGKQNSSAATAGPITAAPFFPPTPEKARSSSLVEGMLLAGRFEIIKCVGTGGTCTVYKALDHHRLTQVESEPCVAVKIPHRRFLDDPLWLETFEQELLHSVRLDHPNIVKVFGYYHDDNRAFIVMEFLHGLPLSDRMRANNFCGLPWIEAAPIIKSMAAALGYAHAQGIVHCDFKPSNVFVTDAGAIKLIDFGIARLINDEATAQANPRRAVTPGYASPGVLDGQIPDPRDDVYSLACTAYELLTGRHPFSHQRAVSARDAGLKVPRANLRKRSLWVFERALAFDPSQRTATVATFARDLENSLTNVEPELKIASTVVGLMAIAWLAIRFNGYDRAADDNLQLIDESVVAATEVPLPTIAARAVSEPPETDKAASHPGPESNRNTVVDDGNSKKIRELLAFGNESMTQLTDPALETSDRTAIETFRQVLRIDPGYAPAIQQLTELRRRYQSAAKAAMQQGRTNAGLNAVRNARFIEPENAELNALEQQLVAQAESKKSDSARTVPETLMHKQINAAAPAKQAADTRIGELLAKAGRQQRAGRLYPGIDDDAWTTFAEILQLDPTNRAARDGQQRIIARIAAKARKLHTAGKHAEGIRLIERGLNLRPNDVTLQRTRTELVTTPKPTPQLAATLTPSRSQPDVVESLPATTAIPAPTDDSTSTPTRQIRHSSTF